MGIDTIGGWPSVLRPLTQGSSLPVDVAGVAMQEILEGNASAAQISASLGYRT